MIKIIVWMKSEVVGRKWSGRNSSATVVHYHGGTGRRPVPVIKRRVTLAAGDPPPTRHPGGAILELV